MYWTSGQDALLGCSYNLNGNEEKDPTCLSLVLLKLTNLLHCTAPFLPCIVFSVVVHIPIESLYWKEAGKMLCRNFLSAACPCTGSADSALLAIPVQVNYYNLAKKLSLPHTSCLALAGPQEVSD